MALKHWTREQLENATKFGVCWLCHEPREVKTETKDGHTRQTLVCPNGHPQD